MYTYACNRVPEDFAATIASKPATSRVVVWWPDEDEFFKQYCFSFVYAVYSKDESDSNGGGAWYVAFVKCCGYRRNDSLSELLYSSLWAQWCTALDGLRNVEYVWLSHHQPEPPHKCPWIATPASRGSRTVFPPFFGGYGKAADPMDTPSVLASPDPAHKHGRWVYWSETCVIPTVSLKLLPMSCLEPHSGWPHRATPVD
jgi:hypothetical protein